MMGYSKISVLAMTAALGTTVFFGANASAQQYSPVSVDSSVQVNWDVADGYGGQPTVPQYLSPTVSRDHIVMPGGDLIFPETKPKSTFLATEQFASATGSDGYDGGFETVVIDGSSGGNAFPTQSEFYGVPGVATASRAPAPQMMDDGANQTIALNQPEPTAAPRTKPTAPSMAETSTSNAPTPLTKPTPAPAPAPSVAETAPEPATEMADAVDAPAAPPVIEDENTAPAAPVAPEVAPIADAPEAPAAPAPDTTQPATEMATMAEPVTEAPAAPAAEEASLPPETAPEPMPAAGADEYSLGFAAESFELSDAAKSQLDSVIAAMGQDDTLRIQLQAYAAGDGSNASKARRLSLSRALQVRSYLIDRGVRSTRIDVRALGANVPSGPADRVDIKTVQR
ncbi:OmpA family protein [Thalassospira sp. HF15]|uniref:OmpA family protein n=1 Tax=Thalassospira sp. HF15 TaxID=2722755 RepID=UPI0014316D5C|nr:OmpA family protein [Thalassospira sp. HF15]NIY75945.1 OmpA family protein [Thalassospira sp. HF15]